MTTKGARRWTESKFTGWFCRCIEQCNGMTFAVVGSRMQSPGWPDRYIAHTAWNGWIEMKRGNIGLNDIQIKICRDLYARGANVYVGIIRRPDWFELRHVDGRTLASVDLLPYIGRDVEAGKMFLRMLRDNNNRETAEHSPVAR